MYCEQFSSLRSLGEFLYCYKMGYLRETVYYGQQRRTLLASNKIQSYMSPRVVWSRKMQR